MDDSKPWYESKTLWGAALAVVSGFVPVASTVLSIPGVHDGAVDLLTGLGSAVGGALAAYGRVHATQSIK
jgi:hypothetical protein